MPAAGPRSAFPSDRARRLCLGLVCAVAAALGVASKLYDGSGRSVVVGQGEDFFGTVFLILAPRIVLLEMALWKIAAVILVIVVAIEFSQLVHGGWIERVRANGLGRRIVGTDFELADLAAYGLAAAAAVAIDRRIARR